MYRLETWCCAVPASNTSLCTDPLDAKKINLFRYAIHNNYYFQMFVDDLPIGGSSPFAPLDMLKECRFRGFRRGSYQDATALHTYPLQFHLQRSTGDSMLASDSLADCQIISVDLTMHNPVPLEDDGAELSVGFSYSVSWHETSGKFTDRFDRYLDSKFFEHKVPWTLVAWFSYKTQIHWFSIFNSFMMVIFLTGLVLLILMRTLRRDFARYDKESELGDLVCVPVRRICVHVKRIAIWARILDGSKFTGMCSGRLHIFLGLGLLSGLVISWSF